MALVGKVPLFLNYNHNFFFTIQMPISIFLKWYLTPNLMLTFWFDLKVQDPLNTNENPWVWVFVCVLFCFALKHASSPYKMWNNQRSPRVVEGTAHIHNTQHKMNYVLHWGSKYLLAILSKSYLFSWTEVKNIFL